jgi:hypothetical protein
MFAAREKLFYFKFESNLDATTCKYRLSYEYRDKMREEGTWFLYQTNPGMAPQCMFN